MSMPKVKRSSFLLEVGDVAPATHGMTFENLFFSLEAQAGRPAALIFAGEEPIGALAPLFEAFQGRAGEFAAHEADVIALVDMQSPHARDFGAHPSPGIRKLFCESDVLRPWGASGSEPLVVVIDRGLRIAAVIDGLDPAASAEAALARVGALPVETPRDIALPAPVLVIPDIFSRELCKELIAHFEASAYQRGGMASRDANGNLFHKVDESKKRRYDFVLGPRDPFLARVLNGIIRRCLPEVKKAFQVDVRHTDRILIARYDDDGGYFLRHRDNAAPGVEFRQFALSINLNSEDYDGGHVIFPEYNSHRYRPGAGAGVVFSCSLLHEATPVVRGRRYVLLTFLHDSSAQARWLEMTKRGL